MFAKETLIVSCWDLPMEYPMAATKAVHNLIMLGAKMDQM